jgi:virginiamycin B lyase
VQYALPAGTHPGDLAHGPYGTLWFTPQIDLSNEPYPPAKVLELTTATGKVHTFTVSNPPGQMFFNPAPSIVSDAGYVFFVIADSAGENEDYFARITPQGALATYVDGADSLYSNFTVGFDGRIWYTGCSEGACSSSGVVSRTTSGTPGPSALLDFLFPAPAVTGGPGGNIYVAGTISGSGGPCDGCGAVDVVTTSGTKLHQFTLPLNSNPASITSGSDHNLWITEPGINKIARMTPTGIIKQFSIPTANAGLDRITYGADLALWFTESNANKIGRITTTGAVTEYPIPLANAFPTGITFCSTECLPHGGVWFTETKANKIGKFIAP